MDATRTLDGLAEALARLASTRDPQAWALILELLGNDLPRLAVAICGDRELAEDAVQETLLQLRDDAGQFTPRGPDADGDAKRWIMRICVTTALQLVRRRRRAAVHAEAHQAFARHDARRQPPPEDGLLKAEQAEAVRRAMSTLPERARTAISLHHVAGLNFSAMAQALGIPEGTAKTRVHRGMAELRARLERSGVALTVATLGSSLSDAGTAVLNARDWPGLLHSPLRAHIHLSPGIHPMALKLALACVASLSVGIVPCAHSEDGGAAPGGAVPGGALAGGGGAAVPRPINPWTGQPGAPAAHARRLFSFEMVRCPPGQPYLQVIMQLHWGAGIDPHAFFTAPHACTVIARNLPEDEALRMIGDATNTHLSLERGVHMLRPGAPPPVTDDPVPFTPGPEADPVLRIKPLNLGYGLSRDDLIDVVVRLLNTNVVVDPAVMESANCAMTLPQSLASFDALLAQLGVRAELRGKVVYILPLPSTQPPEGKPGQDKDKGNF